MPTQAAEFLGCRFSNSRKTEFCTIELSEFSQIIRHFEMCADKIRIDRSGTSKEGKCRSSISPAPLHHSYCGLYAGIVRSSSSNIFQDNIRLFVLAKSPQFIGQFEMRAGMIGRQGDCRFKGRKCGHIVVRGSFEKT